MYRATYNIYIISMINIISLLCLIDISNVVFVICRRSEFIGCLTILVKDVLMKNIEGSFMLQPQCCLTKPVPLALELDEKPTVQETFPQNHQTIEEENNLLKYLELSSLKSSAESGGRTPFTLTRTITKQPEEPFGFEIAWTKPPKINSIKSPSGLQKGDYIIFVEETNVVSLSKEEILKLIQNQGDSLTLEIFRPVDRINSKEIIENLALQNTPVNCRNASSLNLDKLKRKTIVGLPPTTPTSRKSCNFKHPKVCFQPTVGNGVIV